MATVGVTYLKNSTPIPQKLYTPTIKNSIFISDRLYTPNPVNGIVIDQSQILVDPQEIETPVPIQIPDPPLLDIKVPLRIPNLIGPEVSNFLSIPNPHLDEAETDITFPDLDLDTFVSGLYSPRRLVSRSIPIYAYNLPIQDEPGFISGIYETTPFSTWPMNLLPGSWTEASRRGVSGEVAIDDDHFRNRDDFFYMQIMPYEIEDPLLSETRKLNWSIPRVKLPRGYFFNKTYMSYISKPWDSHLNYENATNKKPSLKGILTPNPGFKSPAPPASQDWMNQKARTDEFNEAGADLFSADTWSNVGKEAISQTIGIGGSMLAFGGYDVGGKGHSDFSFGYWPPHIYKYTLNGGVSEDDEGMSWLIGPEKKLKPAKFNHRSRAMHPINLMNSIGPDFMKHKFDAYFVLYDRTGIPLERNITFDNEKWMTPFQKFIFDHKGFAVRFGTISIPKTYQEDYSVKWMETEVKKLRTTIMNDNKATFTFRLDQNLFWLDMVDKLAGHNNTADQLILGRTKGNEQYTNPYYKEGSPFIWKDAIKYVSQSYKTNKRLCLVVKMDHISDRVSMDTQVLKLPYFLFDDIRILGASNSIEYAREGNNIHNMNVNFIFKFLYESYGSEIDPPPKPIPPPPPPRPAPVPIPIPVPPPPPPIIEEPPVVEEEEEVVVQPGPVVKEGVGFKRLSIKTASINMLKKDYGIVFGPPHTMYVANGVFLNKVKAAYAVKNFALGDIDITINRWWDPQLTADGQLHPVGKSTTAKDEKVMNTDNWEVVGVVD